MYHKEHLHCFLDKHIRQQADFHSVNRIGQKPDQARFLPGFRAVKSPTALRNVEGEPGALANPVLLTQFDNRVDERVSCRLVIEVVAFQVAEFEQERVGVRIVVFLLTVV